MTEKNEALRLADALTAATEQTDAEDDVIHVARWFVEDAAAELRRLHALLQEWEAKAATWLASPEAAQRLDGYRELSQRANRAEAQRDALLEALLWIDKRCQQAFMDCPLHTIHREMAHDAGARARAAIKAVEDGK